MPVEERDQADSAAVGFHQVATDHGFEGVVGTFDQDVRSQGRDEIEGGVFAETHDEVHGLQGAQHGGPVVFRKDGTGGPLEPSDGFVGV